MAVRVVDAAHPARSHRPCRGQGLGHKSVVIFGPDIAARSDSTAVMNRLRSSFPPGYMNPFYIVVESTNSAPNSIKSDAFFSKAALLVERLANQTSLQTGDITSIAYVEGLGGVTSWSEAQIALQTSDVYRDFFYQNIDADNTSTIFTVVTPFDPWGDDVAQFNDRVYEVFKSPDLDGDLNMYLCGAPIWMLDAKRKTYELFPYVILGTVLAIFLLISLMFRSAFIPLRYSFTLVFPLSFIFGFAVLIYQYGALDWLGWGALRNVNGMYWLTPIITFQFTGSRTRLRHISDVPRPEVSARGLFKRRIDPARSGRNVWDHHRSRGNYGNRVWGPALFADRHAQPNCVAALLVGAV